jgi:hypothetical protein
MPIVPEPLVDGTERFQFQLAVMDAPVDRPPDQTSAFKDPDVPGDGRKGQVEWLGELGHHGWFPREAREQRASRVVAKGRKDQIELIAARAPDTLVS